MIKKVIIGIGLSVISASSVRILADPIEDWKGSKKVQSAIEKLKVLKDKPAVTNELRDVIWEEIGESLWSKVLATETQENGLEKLKQFHQYLFNELELQNKPIYEETCKDLDQLKVWVDRSENALEIGFCKTLNAVYLEIAWVDIWLKEVVREIIEKLKELKIQISETGATDDTKIAVGNLLKTIVDRFSEDVLIPVIQDEEKTIKEKRENCFKVLKRFYRYLLNVLELEYCDTHDTIGNHLTQAEKLEEMSLYDLVRSKLEYVVEVVSSEIIKLAPIDSTSEGCSKDS